MLVRRNSSLVQSRSVSREPVLVRDMLASGSRQRRDARHAIRAATTVGCNRLARIDMNNRGMRQARAVNQGSKSRRLPWANRVITMR